MSLLMDALKKAERARAARREGEEDEAQQSSALSLENRPEPPREAPEPAGSDADTWSGLGLSENDETPTPDPGAAPAPPTGEGFSLSDDDSMGMSLSEEQLRSVENSLLSSRPRQLAREDMAEIEDATAATLPSMKAARDSVDRYFDDTTGSASLSMEHVLDEGDDETTIIARRQAAEREASQQNARAVFAAKAARRPNSAGRWALFLGLPLVLVLASGGGYVYWLAEGGSSWGPRNGPAPRAGGPALASGSARGTGAPAQDGAPARVASGAVRAGDAGGGQPAAGAGSAAAGAPAGRATSASAAATGGTAVASAANARTNGSDASSSSPVSSRATTTAPPAAPAEGDLTPRPEPLAVAAAGKAASGPAVLSEEQFQQMLRAASPLPRGFSRSGGISIKRTQARDPTRALIARAYESYQAGDLSRAREDYSAVLQRRPRDRDARLGLAAIAMRQGDTERARDHYLRLLAASPRDPVAQAGLIDLFTDLDPVASETQLKSLLARDPAAGYLNFSLGNVYARQARWAEAQAAFFQAYRADDGNPDYSYNLAVSLDQLGQPKAALTYYESALALSQRRPAGFGSGAARARIRAIGQL